MVDGLLLTDLPAEEAKEISEYARRCDVDYISLVAPTTDEGRLQKIVEVSSGFLYLVSVLGVTGARERLESYTIKKLRWVKDRTRLPVAVGFGISKKEHVERIVKEGADGVVVGSAFIDLIEKGASVEKLKSFALELKEGTFR